MCTASHTFTSAGVYGVAITLSDDDGGTASAKFDYVVVVDLNAGFVTGGGWINAPGKVSFAFVSKYQKGDTKPSGNTELQIQATKFNFNSSSMDWLVVAGSKAQFSGGGTVNGSGNYGFILTVIDGDVDKFRIRIWDKSSGATVFDNVAGASDDIDEANPQPIGGGSVVIH
jgi:PKD repeat protein